MSRRPDRIGKNTPSRRRSRPMRLELLEDRALMTILVTTTADNGNNAKPTAGSLRAAINMINAGKDDAIAFSFSSPGIHTLTPSVAYPTIKGSVTIGGTTSSGVPQVMIDGSSAGAGANGLTIEGGSSDVSGLAIVDFKGAGIELETNGDDIIFDDYLGYGADGTVGGNTYGLEIVSSSGNTIEPDSGGHGNVISGNTDGIVIMGNSTGTASTGNVVQGNEIGTDPSGMTAVSNANGIVLGGVGKVTIGGTASGDRNVISGNGVGITGTAISSLIEGNLVGLNAAGSGTIPDGMDGLLLTATGTTIGGTAAGAGNVISGNNIGAGEAGINLTGSADVVEDNDIGVGASGKAKAGFGNTEGVVLDTVGTIVAGNVVSGNATSGVQLNGDDEAMNTLTGNAIVGNGIYGIVVDVPAPPSSPSTPLALGDAIGGNTVAANGVSGIKLIDLDPAGVSGLTLRGNSVYGNSGSEIALAPTGVAEPSSPTVFLNLEAVLGGKVTLGGLYFGRPSTAATVDFFGSAAPDPSGDGPGQAYLGSEVVTTDPAGFGKIGAAFPMPSAGLTTFSATATDSSGTTSEFSVDLSPSASAPKVDLVLNAFPSSGTASVGGLISYTEVVTNPSTTTANSVVLYDTLPPSLSVDRVAISRGVTAMEPGNVLMLALGSLAPGQSATLTIAATVGTSAAGTIVNDAGVASTTLDPGYGNNEVMSVTNITPSTGAADVLAIVQAASAPSVPANQAVIYTITVGNAGATPAYDVTVDDFLPAGLAFTLVGTLPSQGPAPLVNGDLLIDNFGTLAPGAEATLSVALTPNAAGVTVGNLALVTSDQYNLNQANDGAFASTTTTAAVPKIQLALLQSAAPAMGEVGQVDVLTLYVANTGTDPATNVTLNDTLPASVIYGMARASNGATPVAYKGGVLVNFGTIAPGGIVALQVYVGPTVAGMLANVAAVLSPDVPSYAPVISTSAVPVVGGPAITSVVGVGGNAALVLTFDEPLNPASVTASNFRLMATGRSNTGPDQSVAVTPVYNPANDTVTLALAAPLDPSQFYSLTVLGDLSSGVADVTGRHLAGPGTLIAGPGVTGYVAGPYNVFGASGSSFVIIFIAGTLPQA